METMENMTAERSLEIITKSIEQSRRDIERGSWKSMLLWGTCVAVVALVVGHLWANTSWGPRVNALWGVLGIISLFERRILRQQPQKPHTFLSKMIGEVWGCMGIMAGTLGLIALCLGFFCSPAAATQGTRILIPITSIIILFMSMAGMITGRMLRNLPITLCCFISGFAGSTLAIIYHGPYEMVVLAACSVVGLIVPALILKSKEA